MDIDRIAQETFDAARPLEDLIEARREAKDDPRMPFAPRALPIVCRDGFEISVQASSMVYCHPREDIGPWTHVECGFPSEVEPDLMPYAEDPATPTHTVYGWVPADIVMCVIQRHGGAVEVHR